MKTSDITETVENLQDKAKDFQDQATEEANRWKDCALETAKTATQATDRFVQDNVWTTVAIAALAGCAIGFLLARDND